MDQLEYERLIKRIKIAAGAVGIVLAASAFAVFKLAQPKAYHSTDNRTSEPASVDSELFPYGPPEELTNTARFTNAFIRSNGGIDAIESINSIRLKGSFVVGTASFNFVGIKRKPDKLKLTFPEKSGDVTVFINGKLGWKRINSIAGGGETLARLTDREQTLFGQLAAFYSPILRNIVYENDSIKTISGFTSDHGKQMLKVELVLDGAEPTNLEIDPTTMQPMRQTKYLDNGDAYITEYTKYINVDGMHIALEADSRINGSPFTRVSLENVSTNIGTTESLFAPPAELFKTSE